MEAIKIGSPSKMDFKKQFKELYHPPADEAVVIDVPAMNFLMIDGQGDPNIAQEYKDAVEALYSVSYTLKFNLKKQGGFTDYVVPPLEGLWWVDDMNEFSTKRKDDWKWTMMIRQPEFGSDELAARAIEEVRKKKNLPGLDKLRFENWCEGLAAQIMHIGPYSEEGPTVEKLHNFIKENGYELRAKHHEIYLGDPRKTPPEKLKTVVRQPMAWIKD